MTRYLRIGLIVALTFAWIASGLWAAGNWNAAMRAQYPHLYEKSVWANSTGKILWGIMFGPFAAVLTLSTDGVAPHWTLTSQPFPCTEKTQFERHLWCGED